jgi:hypothetical protein
MFFFVISLLLAFINEGWHQRAALSLAAREGNAMGQFDIEVPADPMVELFERLQFGAALEKASLDWDEQLSTEGNDLHKQGDIDGTTVDLSKRASPYKVRFERTIIDGSQWILGWNDKGENIYGSPLEDHERMHKVSEEI